MNRRLLITLIGIAAVGAVIAIVYVNRPALPAPEPEPTTATLPAPRPAPRATTPSVEPPAEAPATASRAPRAAPAPPPASPSVEAAPTVATLHIDSDVPGAQVFINRRFVGEAPVTASDIEPGTHTLNVSAKGYESIGQSIDVSPGSRDITVKFRVVRLDATLQVVHKHRMGSCTGRLVATPQGLRYETSDKDDAFTTPLTDLETFEVDYMAKNLRIKPLKGKRYDFTDPEGNADRLFVFHRDVEKARERLKAGDLPASQ